MNFYFFSPAARLRHLRFSPSRVRLALLFLRLPTLQSLSCTTPCFPLRPSGPRLSSCCSQQHCKSCFSLCHLTVFTHSMTARRRLAHQPNPAADKGHARHASSRPCLVSDSPSVFLFASLSVYVLLALCSATQPPAQPASSVGQSRSPTSVAGIIHGQGHCHGMDVVVAASKQASKHQVPAGKQYSTRDEARRAPIVQPYPLQPESMQRFSLHHSKSASCLLLIYSTGSRGWVATRNLQPFLCYALPCLSVPSSPYSSLSYLP